MHLSWILPRLLSECGAPLTRRLAMLGDPVTVEDFPAEVFIVTDAPDLTGIGPANGVQAQDRFRRDQRGTFSRNDGERRVSSEGHCRFTETVASDDFLKAMAEWFEGRAK